MGIHNICIEVSCNVDLKICSLPLRISTIINGVIKYPKKKNKNSRTGKIINAYLIPNLFIIKPDNVSCITNDMKEVIE